MVAVILRSVGENTRAGQAERIPGAHRGLTAGHGRVAGRGTCHSGRLAVITSTPVGTMSPVRLGPMEYLRPIGGYT